jgi:hypothetical protein
VIVWKLSWVNWKGEHVCNEWLRTARESRTRANELLAQNGGKVEIEKKELRIRGGGIQTILDFLNNEAGYADAGDIG